MAAQPVEWVLVIYYGASAHRATYGRLEGSPTGNKYTKDYIQLSRRPEFVEVLNQLFPETVRGERVDVVFRWPGGTMPGAFDFSADRWHLKWETRLGAPRAWKMHRTPSDATAETIPGDPSHQDSAAAEREFDMLSTRGAGQPYLVAIRLRGDPNTLHVRAYLSQSNAVYSWASLDLAPQKIRDLAAQVSPTRHTSWSQIIDSGGVLPTHSIRAVLSRFLTSADPQAVINALDAETGRALAGYLQDPGRGLFFDPDRNHDAWVDPGPLTGRLPTNTETLVAWIESRFPVIPEEDVVAETLDVNPGEVEAFSRKIEIQNYEVPDATTTAKTRGSAQKAFASAVKPNYGYRCAITGITSREFLVASHIVPWSEDQSIRLDPTNGICLSLLVDRAFERGFLLIDDDYTIRIDWNRVGTDEVLRRWLEPYDGQRLNLPETGRPRPEYLRRRRELAARSC